MTREKLPQRRYCETFDVAFPLHSFNYYAVTIGCFADGRIGEVFIASYQKAGSMADLAARDAALLISIALQHGAPLEVMHAAATRAADGQVEGLVGVVLARMMARQIELLAEVPA
jgi:hypothetical protein